MLENDASSDFSYISTPRLIQNPNNVYAHIPNAGRGIRVYDIDDGAVPTLGEFTAHNVIKENIHALGSSPRKPDETNHGSCLASEVGGICFGVAKKADLIIVQIEVEIISLLDGFERIIVECQTQVEAVRNVHNTPRLKFHLDIQDSRPEQMNSS